MYWSRIETRLPRLTFQRQSASATAQPCVKLAVIYSNVINIDIRQKWRKMSHSAGVNVSHNLTASQITYLQKAYSVTATLICSG